VHLGQISLPKQNGQAKGGVFAYIYALYANRRKCSWKILKVKKEK